MCHAYCGMVTMCHAYYGMVTMCHAYYGMVTMCHAYYGMVTMCHAYCGYGYDVPRPLFMTVVGVAYYHETIDLNRGMIYKVSLWYMEKGKKKKTSFNFQ